MKVILEDCLAEILPKLCHYSISPNLSKEMYSRLVGDDVTIHIIYVFLVLSLLQSHCTLCVNAGLTDLVIIVLFAYVNCALGPCCGLSTGYLVAGIHPAGRVK